MAALTTTAMDNEGPAVAEAQVIETETETEATETEVGGKARRLIITQEITCTCLG